MWVIANNGFGGPAAYTGTDKTKNTSIPSVLLAFTPGVLTVLGVTMDDATATTPSVSNIPKLAGETANWTLLAKHDSNSTGGGSVRSEIWGIVPQNTSGGWTSYTLTINASVTAKAWVSTQFLGGQSTLATRGTVPAAGLASSGTISSSVATLTGWTPQVGELVLRIKGIEGATYPTFESGVWRGVGATNTTGSGAASNLGVLVEYIVIGTAGDVSFSYSDSGDKGVAVSVLQAGAPPAQCTLGSTGSLEAHRTRYEDIVKAKGPLFYYRFNERPEDMPTAGPENYNLWQGPGTWWMRDESAYARDQQVFPSNAQNPGAPMKAGYYWRSPRDVYPDAAKLALAQPGLTEDGGSFGDMSFSPLRFTLEADGGRGLDALPVNQAGGYTPSLRVDDFEMDLAGGGRYYPSESGPQRISVACMLNLEAFPSQQGHLYWHGGGRWYFDLLPDGRLRFQTYLGYPSYPYVKTQTIDLYTPSALQLGRTYHVAAVMDGTYSRIFLDGAKVAEQDIRYLYITPGTNEVQTLSITGTPTGGSFTLTFNGQTTAPIACPTPGYSYVTAAAIQSALDGLSNVVGYAESGNAYQDIYVSMTSSSPSWNYNLSFQEAGQYKWTDVPQITATSSLTGGSSPTITTGTSTQGVAAPGTSTLYNGEIHFTNGSGGTNGGNSSIWVQGDLEIQGATNLPGRIDEWSFFGKGLTEADVTELATAAFAARKAPPNAVVSPGAAFYGHRVKSGLTALKSSYREEVLASKPAAYYRLGDASGSTVMTDSSGNGRHGSYVGSPELGFTSLLTGDTDASMRPSAVYTTTAKGGQVPNASWQMGTSYTWECVFRYDTSSAGTLIAGGNASTYLAWNGSYLQWNFVGTSLLTGYFNSQYGARCHVAVVVNGTSHTMYLNGEWVGAYTAASPGTNDGTTPLKIGHRTSAQTGMNPIDEVVIHDRALDAESIRNRYRAIFLPSQALQYETSTNVSGSGSLTATGTARPVATANLTGDSAETSDGRPNLINATSLDGDSVLLVETVDARQGVADPSGDGALTTSGTAGLTEEGAGGGEGLLEAIQTGIGFLDQVSASGSGEFTAVMVETHSGSANLAGGGLLDALGINCAADFDGWGTLVAEGPKLAEITLSGDGELVATTYMRGKPTPGPLVDGAPREGVHRMFW